jgi:hypothetical protein
MRLLQTCCVRNAPTPAVHTLAYGKVEHGAEQVIQLPNTAHTSRPWRIHEIAPDFKLEDVWELPGRGDPGDFRRLVGLITSFDPSQSSSHVFRVLWASRWKVGRLLGWDDSDGGLGSRVVTLHDRLPTDLVRRGRGPDFTALPFTPLYLTDDEFAAEIANKTMHGVMHIGTVEDRVGSFRVQMAVLVKPNGRFGSAYMAAIRPFRHLIVYPALTRQGLEMWERSGGSVARDSQGLEVHPEDRQWPEFAERRHLDGGTAGRLPGRTRRGRQ